MGYNTNMNAIARFEEKYGKELGEHFSFLAGKKIESFTGAKDSGYHIEGSVCIQDEGSFDTHYCWSTQYDKRENEENIAAMNNYYEKYLIGKTITHVEVGGWERDDFVYIIARVVSNHSLEIPLISIDEIYQEGY